MTLASALHSLVNKENLQRENARECAEELIAGTADPIVAGAFLACLATKGETVDEITGLALAMQHAATQVSFDFPILDTCGTGGDTLQTFNISTASAFVAAGAGAKVAKHGNRSITSKSGSADVLESLGININLSPESVVNAIKTIGIGFFFAPNYHPAMKYIMPVRKSLGIRTVFNILGPIISPAHAKHQVMGVPTFAHGEKLIQVYKNLGSTHVLIVHGEDGMDEISTATTTHIWEYRKETDEIKNFTISPELFGVTPTPVSYLQVATVSESAAVIEGIFKGTITDIRKEAVQINSAAALIAYNLTTDWKEAYALAGRTIAEGKAWEKVEQLRAIQE